MQHQYRKTPSQISVWLLAGDLLCFSSSLTPSVSGERQGCAVSTRFAVQQ